MISGSVAPWSRAIRRMMRAPLPSGFTEAVGGGTCRIEGFTAFSVGLAAFCVAFGFDAIFFDALAFLAALVFFAIFDAAFIGLFLCDSVCAASAHHIHHSGRETKQG